MSAPSVGSGPPLLPVLMYHAVGSPMPSSLRELSVAPALLREQLDALRESGRRLLGLTDALAAQRRGELVAALTFDDAYRDFTESALPVLSDARAGATLYAPTRSLGGTAEWMPGAAAQLPLLATSDLAEVAAAGVEVGSHGARHVPMDVLPPATAAAYLLESRSALEDAVQAPVTSLCYPHGYTSRRLRRQVAAAGYTSACAIGHRLHAVDEDPLAVSRLLVGPQHDPAGLVELVRHGPRSMAPQIKRAAAPAWRVVRRTALRTANATWT